MYCDMEEQKGKMVIVCAPSGSGKTTIVKAILPGMEALEFSVSACSRPPREGEVHGKDYYFLSPDEFRRKIQENAFLEWEEVYQGNFYGTLKSEVTRIWSMGKHVIFDVDVLGGLNIKKQYPHSSLAVFILPPSIVELKKRLLNRGTETEESLNKRVSRAEYELGFAGKFDVQIVNDDLDKAIEKTRKILQDFLQKTS